jgi:hypothetical protein
MPPNFTKVFIAGKVTDAGIKMHWNESGVPEATWTTIVEECGANGATWKVFVPCSA